MSKKKDLNYFTVTDKNGKETEYEILFTFESNDTDKNYIVYTSNELDGDDMIKTYASIYEENDGVLKLTPIEDEKEWALVEKLIDQATDEESKEEKVEWYKKSSLKEPLNVASLIENGEFDVNIRAQKMAETIYESFGNMVN